MASLRYMFGNDAHQHGGLYAQTMIPKHQYPEIAIKRLVLEHTYAHDHDTCLVDCPVMLILT